MGLGDSSEFGLAVAQSLATKIPKNEITMLSVILARYWLNPSVNRSVNALLHVNQRRGENAKGGCHSFRFLEAGKDPIVGQLARHV